MELIDKKVLLKEFERENSRSENDLWHITGIKAFVENAPSVEAFPKSYVDQIRWERDVAIEKLDEIGCGLGENMDSVKNRLESRPNGEWIEGDLLFEGDLCSVCKTRIYNTNGMNFCPHCGARMKEE